MFWELLEYENENKKLKAEVKVLKRDNKQKEGAIINLEKRYSPFDDLVEEVKGEVKRALNKREKKTEIKQIVLPSISERRAK